MKKIVSLMLCILMITALFAGCSAEERANFNGSADEYIYMYEEGRNRDWEEDIIYLAKTFIETHPLLIDGNSFVYNVSPGNLTVESMNFYDGEIYNDFIDKVNLLIPKIDELSDEAVFVEMERLIAVLGDEYSFLYNQNGPEYCFPVMLRGFHDGDGYNIYVLAVAEEHSDLLYSSLYAINGVPVKELAERIKELYPVNDGAVYSVYCDYFSIREYLAAMGVVGFEDETATYTFIKEDGTKTEREISVAPISEFPEGSYEGASYYSKDHSTNFWYEIFDDETVYMRINSFHEEKYTSLGKIAKEISEEANENNIGKIIIDLRGNPGGSMEISGYDEFLKTVCEEKYGKVYILSNETNMQLGIMTASIIRKHGADAIIVGSKGRNPNFFNYGGKYFLALPNSELLFTCSDRMIISWPGYEYDMLMPDIEIYQTLEDYKNGVDTVLEAVLEME